MRWPDLASYNAASGLAEPHPRSHLPPTIHSVAGELLHLLPQRAAYWPREKMLIIADIHFGKAAAFRAQGVPVPHGTTSQNLAVLEGLLAQHDIHQIIFLGDFLHAKTAQAAATLSALQRWRMRYPTLKLTLVRGNHDHHAGDPPPNLQIEVVNAPFRLAPFAFCHHPDPVSGSYVLAGHVHPVYRLTAQRDSLRLPCFLFGSERAILPSFGAFTGGFAIAPGDSEAVYVATDDAVFKVPQMPKSRF